MQYYLQGENTDKSVFTADNTLILLESPDGDTVAGISGRGIDLETMR